MTFVIEDVCCWEYYRLSKSPAHAASYELDRLIPEGNNPDHMVRAVALDTYRILI